MRIRYYRVQNGLHTGLLWGWQGLIWRRCWEGEGVCSLPDSYPWSEQGEGILRCLGTLGSGTLIVKGESLEDSIVLSLLLANVIPVTPLQRLFQLWDKHDLPQNMNTSIVGSLLCRAHTIYTNHGFLCKMHSLQCNCAREIFAHSLGWNQWTASAEPPTL